MATPPEPLPTTKAEEAFIEIRRLIECGRLPGGAKLTLASLSDELQMSLTPIREALRMLQANGLVEYKRHHGHVVTRYSIRRAEETYLLRQTLEPLATRLAAANATEDELRRIRELQEEFRLVVDGERLASPTWWISMRGGTGWCTPPRTRHCWTSSSIGCGRVCPIKRSGSCNDGASRPPITRPSPPRSRPDSPRSPNAPCWTTSDGAAPRRSNTCRPSAPPRGETAFGLHCLRLPCSSQCSATFLLGCTRGGSPGIFG